MNKSQRDKALTDKHEKTLWAHFANVFLGFWLMVAHIAFGYTSFLMSMNDCITGIVIVVFACLSLSRHIIIAPWLLVLAGIWLNFAPLIFWAPDSVAYANDSIVGVLVIACALLIPGLPGVIEKKGLSVPAGWSYNPSAWIQRLPVIALACVGWFISRYLAGYQLGYFTSVWDPVFGQGTKDVITSSVAHFFPVPDAGLGAFAYTLEALLGLKGGENRWRSMPWLVVGFVLLVVPLGVVSIILVCLQPILVGQWCFLCLLAAGAMLIMVMLTVDEMIAVFQFLYQGTQEGQSFWKLFWHGGEVRGIQEDKSTPSFQSSPLKLMASWHRGVSCPISLILTALIGAWLMLTPWVFNLVKLTADSDHLIGALCIVLSIISMGEVVRSLRFLMIPLGLWLAIASWFLPGAYTAVNLNHFFAGLLVIILCIPRGTIHYKYGRWDRFIR